MRETDAIRLTVDDVIYNLLEIKYPNYVIRMMANGVHLFADDTYKDTVRRRKENAEDVAK